MGRLNQTIGNGVTTRFGYDGADLIAEYDESGAITRRYIHGAGTDDPILWYEGAGTNDKRYLHKDERGSVTAITSGTGAVLAINSYDEYGIPAETNLGRFQYTGQTWLPEADLYYYKARIYSPTLGRFLQTDPIGYSDGMNWYNYVGSDQINKSDPTGLCDLQIVDYAWYRDLGDGKVGERLGDAGTELTLINCEGGFGRVGATPPFFNDDAFPLFPDPCNANAGDVFDDKKTALEAAARAAEKERKNSDENGKLNERAGFVIPSGSGFTFTPIISLVKCNVNDPQTLTPPRGATILFHSHRPNCGNGLSDADKKAVISNPQIAFALTSQNGNLDLFAKGSTSNPERITEVDKTCRLK